MGHQDNRPDSAEVEEYRTARDRLRTVIRELESLQHQLRQTETEKSSLTEQIAKLEARFPSLISKPSPAVAPKSTPAPPKSASQVSQGLFLAFMSAVVLSVFNVCLKIILKTSPPEPRNIFGILEMQGLIAPGVGNSLLILFLRMVVVMSVMPILSPILYPAVWSDIKRFIQSKDYVHMLKVVGSGLFLFVSQVSIYVAIGNIPTGVAITIFFIYPIVTVLASWGLFGDRPTIVRIIAMFVITVGGILALPSFFGGATGNLELGVAAAVVAGIAFAGYVLLVGMSTKKMHPVPMSLVSFAAIFVFSASSLMLPLPEGLNVVFDRSALTGILIGGVVLGLLTLASYLLNNIAIRFAGPSLASIIGTSGPALTAFFGWIAISETLSAKQWSGLGFVTLGVLSMSLERMFAPKK